MHSRCPRPQFSHICNSVQLAVRHSSQHSLQTWCPHCCPRTALPVAPPPRGSMDLSTASQYVGFVPGGRVGVETEEEVSAVVSVMSVVAVVLQSLKLWYPQ